MATETITLATLSFENEGMEALRPRSELERSAGDEAATGSTHHALNTGAAEKEGRLKELAFSMLFVGQMVGFVSAGLANTYLTERFGLGKVITLGAIIQAGGYLFLIPAFPFPAMPCFYGVVGFGMALQIASANTYISTLPNTEQRFGYLHACYGLGALVCPLAATAYASSGKKFSYFWAISIGLAALSVLSLLVAFRFNYRIEEPTTAKARAQPRRGLDTPEERSMELRDQSEAGESRETVERVSQNNAEEVDPRGAFQQTLSSKVMWTFAVFILAYAGYVATGYWGGIAIGRIACSRINTWVGEKRVIFFYLPGVVALQLAIWFAHNLVANAVAASFVGFLLGPLFPNTMALTTKTLPRRLHNTAIGFIAAFGQTGSAIFPFLTGILAQKYSTYALQPMMIVLSLVMMGVWWNDVWLKECSDCSVGDLTALALNTNTAGAELVSAIVETHGAGVPISFLLVSPRIVAGKSAAELAHAKAAKLDLTKQWLRALRAHKINPEFILCDKDFNELVAFQSVYPQSKIQLCSWHVKDALRKRLGLPPSTKPSTTRTMP
ncbi:MFS efflux transporter [Pseudohyphozyma bogoriensis]|nr:MFS efflux transporter [Pseudohyphozyma bogoriensis]